MSHPGPRVVGAAFSALLLTATLEPAPRPGATSPLGCAAQPADGQDPRPHCCFANPRHVGTCEVVPAKDETCASILAYLNNPQSQGKSYCDSTSLRGGWKPERCEPKMKQD